MSTRIRYDLNDEGTTLTSRRLFRTGAGVEAKAVIDATSMKFTIVDAVTGDTLASGGDTINLAVAKIQTKEALTELGVRFDEEKRAERRSNVDEINEDASRVYSAQNRGE